MGKIVLNKQNYQVMKVQSLSRFNSTKKLGTLTKNHINKVAKACGFHQRSRGKINAYVLIQSFMLILVHQGRSYRDWAISLSSVINDTVSKQAVFNRLNGSFTQTLKVLLKDVICKQAGKSVKTELFEAFKRVWLQDSTSLHLPDAANILFKGNISGGQQKAIAKLNVVVDILTGATPIMELMSFTDNEQKLASRKLPILRKGDLLIRDLGYFVLSAFEQLNSDKIFFLSRLRYGINLYHPITHKAINLSVLLDGKSVIDTNVVCGKKKSLKVRLVAIKLSEEQTNNRIRKAKTNRDKRLNHNTEYYKLLGYAIFITNVSKECWTARQVAEAYRVRWNIEILFKSWKSGIHIADLIPDAKNNLHRIESVLYLILLYICWFQLKIYIPLKWNKEISKKGLSIIKTVKHLFMKPHLWLYQEIISQTLYEEILYYCCYDKRKDRTNATQLFKRI